MKGFIVVSYEGKIIDLDAVNEPVIRTLTFDDLDGAFKLSTIIGWNQRLDDWRMLLRLTPNGAFAALAGGRIVGTAMGIDYGSFAWIAMMLVDPAYRGRGLGRRLLEAAMNALPSALPVRLDATPLGRPLYQRYGFEDEAALSRYVTNDTRRGAVSYSCDVRPLAPSDLPIVIAQDRETFCGTRADVLNWALENAPQYSYLAPGVDGAMSYCLGRQGRQFDQIGPVVAGNDEVAQALVSTALAAPRNRPVVVDAFDAERGFAAWLRGYGFSPQRPLVRMCKGAFERRDAASRRIKELAILGPEFG